MDPAPDAIALLETNQLALQQLFAEYAELVRHDAAFARRRLLAERICTRLAIWRRLRDELVDPAAGLASGTDAAITECIARVLAAHGRDEAYDARMTALRERVERDARRERDLVFLRLRAARVDLEELGRALALRQRELHTVADALREDALAGVLL
jgi:hypothetical protein